MNSTPAALYAQPARRAEASFRRWFDAVEGSPEAIEDELAVNPDPPLRRPRADGSVADSSSALSGGHLLGEFTAATVHLPFLNSFCTIRRRRVFHTILSRTSLSGSPSRSAALVRRVDELREFLLNRRRPYSPDAYRRPDSTKLKCFGVRMRIRMHPCRRKPI